MIVLIVINAINLERGMDDTLWFIMGNWYFWFSLLALCGIIGIPFFILRRAEYFFGGFIVNLILQKKINNIYLVKYCQKKVEQMTRVNRSVAKFIKIYKNRDETTKIDNFADQQMKKIVDEFRVNRKKYKRSKKNRAAKNQQQPNIIQNNLPNTLQNTLPNNANYYNVNNNVGIVGNKENIVMKK